MSFEEYLDNRLCENIDNRSVEEAMNEISDIESKFKGGED